MNHPYRTKVKYFLEFQIQKKKKRSAEVPNTDISPVARLQCSRGTQLILFGSGRPHVLQTPHTFTEKLPARCFRELSGFIGTIYFLFPPAAHSMYLDQLCPSGWRLHTALKNKGQKATLNYLSLVSSREGECVWSPSRAAEPGNRTLSSGATKSPPNSAPREPWPRRREVEDTLQARGSGHAAHLPVQSRQTLPCKTTSYVLACISYFALSEGQANGFLVIFFFLCLGQTYHQTASSSLH